MTRMISEMTAGALPLAAAGLGAPARAGQITVHQSGGPVLIEAFARFAPASR